MEKINPYACPTSTPRKRVGVPWRRRDYLLLVLGLVFGVPFGIGVMLLSIAIPQVLVAFGYSIWPYITLLFALAGTIAVCKRCLKKRKTS